MDVSFIPFSFPAVPRVRCLFQTRLGGSSAKSYGGGNISYVTNDLPEHVCANRKALQKALGCPFSELSQVHGDKLVFEPSSTPVEGSKGALPEADGQATCKAGLALMIKSADCQPILLAHKNGSAIMGLHVGWRGNRINFIASAIDAFCQQYDIVAKDVFAVRGPSLGPQMAEFVNFATEWGQEYVSWYDAAAQTLDLWALTRHQLRQSGVPQRQIFGLDMCTRTLHEMFFSYRYKKESGRQASLIWIQE